VLSALAAGCQGPAGPSSDGFAGAWNGTTAQGRPIAFTVSSAETVTAIMLGHDFNGCAGSQTFANLSISIVPNVQCIPGPCPPALTSYRGFGYVSDNTPNGPWTSVNALFTSNGRAEGTVNFRAYSGCADAVGVPFSATRR
jgi:hypothetical protein